jgi:hypothetical protein
MKITRRQIRQLIQEAMAHLNEGGSSLVKDAIFSSKKGGMKVDFGSGDSEVKLIGKDGSVFTAKILKRVR